MAGRKNLMGQPMQVQEMESELGAAGATHGALCGGALATTFTASQGLLLMIPNMFKIAGELLPGVFHVGSRSVATHALSIFSDHSDVMACRTTGFAMLCSTSVQETLDLAAVAHMAAIEGSVPVLHWFDGWRTSNEMQTIDVMEYDDLRGIVDWQKVLEFRRRGMNPEHSDVRGTAQNPDIFFQNREAANKYYDAMPGIVQRQMDKMAALTGRQYHLFDYTGAPDAEYVTVSMGSSSDVIAQTIEYLNSRGYKLGHITVRLYRPFADKAFVEAVPQTVKAMAVLDRTKEPGSQGEPLYLDVCTALYRAGRMLRVSGGRYGLGSKEFNPAMVKAIFDELAKPDPKPYFTVGITDDVTNLSLDVAEEIDPISQNAVQSIFYGIGADGTVGATKQAASIISDNTGYYSQAYFSYSAKKSGGYTISQLRFDKQPIRAAYSITEADYVGCNKDTYVKEYDMLSRLKEGGIFVLNSQWTPEDLETQLPADVKRQIARKKIRFYNVDAVAVARKHNLGQRINMIMETVFFNLTGIMPVSEAVKCLKEQISWTYGHEGQDVVEANCAAVDDALSAMVEVEVPGSWADAVDSDAREAYLSTLPEWVREVAVPMNRLQGDKLPVSKMIADGVFPAGTTAYEKRRIAINIPEWDADKCIECTECSFVCSHAAIRPYVATDAELKGAPASFVTKDAWAKPLAGMKWRIQVYPEDCTGCGSCSEVCPASALPMVPIQTQLDTQIENLEFAQKNITSKSGKLPRRTIDGSQLYTPLLEFSGACGGCGETPYIKLLTQLFGEHMVVANATGCSSIWSANAPSQAWCRNEQGLGSAWGNSLFEDNAEYGYGIAVALAHRRNRLTAAVEAAAAHPDMDAGISGALNEWLQVKNDCDKSYLAGQKIRHMLDETPALTRIHPELQTVSEEADLLGKKTVWIIGGDGWAYDIGFAGLDHVLASGIDVNIFVMDTQCYSNTGGQTSKATPHGACTKYNYDGKRTFRKNLGEMMMTYRNVYVASVAIGGNMNQTVHALCEAADYPGPSLVIGYCPCIAFGIKQGMSHSIIAERDAVLNHFWPLYRFNPSQKENPLTYDRKDTVVSPALPAPPKWSPKPGVQERIVAFGESSPRNGADNPLIVDNQPVAPVPVEPMLQNETRYAVLTARVPQEEAEKIYQQLQTSGQQNVERLLNLPS